MKKSVVGLMLPPWARLTPVSEEDFIASVYENICYLDEIPQRYKGSMSLFNEASWEGSEEQIALLDMYSGFYELLKEFYLYAEKGINQSHNKCSFGEDDFVFSIEPLAMLHSLKEWHGVGTWAVEKLIYKAFARMKLDTYVDAETDDLVTLSSGFLPMAHTKHLTLLEVALLAGVTRVRSIRNSTYDKVNRLNTIKEGGNVLVTVDEARRWLLTKPKFVPSPDINYG